MLDLVHRIADGPVQKRPVQIAVRKGVGDVLHAHAQGVQRLPPLVGDGAEHFAHGREFRLLDQDLFTLHAQGDFILDAALERFRQGFERMVLYCSIAFSRRRFVMSR